MTIQLTPVRPEPVEGPARRMGFDRLSPNGCFVRSVEIVA